MAGFHHCYSSSVMLEHVLTRLNKLHLQRFAKVGMKETLVRCKDCKIEMFTRGQLLFYSNFLVLFWRFF